MVLLAYKESQAEDWFLVHRIQGQLSFFLSCVCVCVTRTRICACMYLHKTCIMCLPYSCMNCMLVCFKGSFIELENVELTSDKITCIDK